MMNPEIKQKWVSALRSDDFPQTTGRLHDKYGYCCIGVLCEVVKPGNFVPYVSEISDYCDGFSFDGERHGLPDSIRAEIGYSKEDERIFDRLISMNDGGTSDFNKIADKIEELL